MESWPLTGREKVLRPGGDQRHSYSRASSRKVVHCNIYNEAPTFFNPIGWYLGSAPIEPS